MAFYRESDIPAWLIDVKPFTAVMVEGPMPGSNSSKIVHLNQVVAGQVSCKVDWTLTGLIADIGMWHPGAYWDVELLVELFGPAEGVAIPAPPGKTVKQGPVAGPHSHSVSIVLPAGMVVGTYKLALALTLWDPSGTHSLFHGIENFGSGMLRIIDTV